MQIREIVLELARRIPEPVTKPESLEKWTRGVYDALSQIASQQGWNIYPKGGPYKGEYLCDFMLVEEDYGVRIACESQWTQRVGDHQQRLCWAFDKLRGVKADVKLFIFEGTEQQWQAVEDEYLYGYAQLYREELFVLLRWLDGQFHVSAWTPERNGVQPNGSIHFAAI